MGGNFQLLMPPLNHYFDHHRRTQIFATTSVNSYLISFVAEAYKSFQNQRVQLHLSHLPLISMIWSLEMACGTSSLSTSNKKFGLKLNLEPVNLKSLHYPCIDMERIHLCNCNTQKNTVIWLLKMF